MYYSDKKEIRELSAVNRANIKVLLTFRHVNRFILRRLFQERRELKEAWNCICDQEDRAYARAERYATSGEYYTHATRWTPDTFTGSGFVGKTLLL